MKAGDLIGHVRPGLPGVLLGLPLIFVIEAVLTLVARTSPPAAAAPGVLALAAVSSVMVLWSPAVVSVLVDALTQAAKQHQRAPRRAMLAAVALLFAGFTGHWYLVLIEYEPFRGYIPLIAVAVASLVAFTAHAWLGSLDLERRRWLLPAGHVATLLACVVAYVANYTVYSGLYPTLHHAVVLLTAMCMFRGASGLLTYAPAAVRRWGSAAGLAATLALSVAGAAGLGDESKPYFYNSSELGRIASMSEDATTFASDGKLETATPGEHLARFEKANGLPTLEPTFRLEDYNILVIASEATRFDKTSLAKDGPNTTPNIANAATNAWVAERAYSPSSGTLHSMSSLFTMKFPSAIEMSTWMQPWYGELQAGEVTAAELFAEHGYDTFWIGHDHNLGFSRSILGLEQGFETVNRVTEFSRGHRPTTDAKIAKNARRHLEKLARTPDKRFFGFVFFVSPHGPYLSHGFDDLPSKSELHKYQQEIRNVDRQFGTVFESLKQTKLLDKTIVIFLSDHGEEFREHGGTRHKSTVYTESIHVPLVIWLPGLEPTRSKMPLSTIYVLPWLLLHAETPGLKAAAEQVITDVIGPILAATDNAVVSELVGHDRIRSALTYEQYKLNYDYRSKLFELYDVQKDPLEQKDLFATSDQEHWRKVFERYDAARQATLKHTFLPKKKALSIGQYRKKLREERKSQKQSAKKGGATSP